MKLTKAAIALQVGSRTPILPMTNYEMPNREWWVLRWLDLLEKYRFKKRLERGRNYAREGNILSIDFEGAQVKAKVQGTAEEPYELAIYLDPFSDEDWNYVIQTLSEKAIYSAQLLAGEMPVNIEAVFTANGLSLFPYTLAEVRSSCSCPDPKNPCKHIAAVYYQLGDRFSEDPFVLFQLRGRTREQILQQIREIRAHYTDTSTGADEEHTPASTTAMSEETPLQIEHFWHYEAPLEASLTEITPSEGETVLDRLGPLPLVAADAKALREYIERVYQRSRSLPEEMAEKS